MRKVLEMTFAGEDYRVLTADSAESALSLARAEHPAVVLADATLEDKSGYELCQALKREMPNVPVLVLSSKLHPYDPAKGQAARVDDHLDKPFDTQQLIDKVRALASAQPARPAAPPAGAVAARPAAPAPAPARPAVAPAAAPAAARPAAPAPAPGPRPAPPQNLRQTVAYPTTGAVPTAPARPPQAQPQPRPAAPAAAPPAARPAAPAAAHPAAATPAAATAGALGGADAEFGKKLAGLGLNKQQIEGVLALSHEVVERVVWEVVPILAETIIKEELKRLTAD
jgi:CheY-like chemotaxis protein